ncbi:MAG: DUF493 family protein [Burkholderiaceae bacterium]|jgi:putative lipoic acid-binding regulatory protein|nr:MAG: DUF493 family protein [Burkholderiaceae bacterium]
MSASKTPPHTVPNEESLIEYPCIFPIKVMGKAEPAFRPAMLELVARLDPLFNDTKIEERQSSGGNYVSLTLHVHATSREQLDEIYRGVTGHPLVKWAI